MNINTVYIKLMGTLCLGIGLVVIVFLSAEKAVQRNNAFTRRYPPHPLNRLYELNLGFNSYYIAGFEGDDVYLGNHTAPRHLLQINLITKDTSHLKIGFQTKNLPFRNLRTALYPPHFFIMDGTSPFILRGEIGEWIAKPWIKDAGYFLKAVPIDSNKIYISTVSTVLRRTVLGLLKKKDKPKLELNPDLLTPQIDGMFDSDGTLLFNGDSKTLGYAYLYRNELLIINPELNLIKKLKTIDTITTAQIHLAIDSIDHTSQLKAPPLVVNKAAVFYGDLALVHSPRLGKNEPAHMLQEAAIIDVYNWRKDTYEFSFYIHNSENGSVKKFQLHDTWLVALMGKSISVYQLEPSFFRPHVSKTK
ncbi:hypothetical protein D2V08_01185 [Flagellimonas lutimaris]|uniref:DUF4221 domain-containing protein n=1 Tax=Flagellimonas lutimaris TaxID=475082 RepID=A0A3A1NB19_9FLAO|nr:hypothetical protein [Allomuricauda lutimaris]RIV37503.1 hypothetical protein D2V08_01185 [Allomuricauda lutimaris]